MTNEELSSLIKFVQNVPITENQQKMLTMLKDELRNKKVKAPKMPRLFQPYKGEYYETLI
jgi:hypothetical protein